MSQTNNSVSRHTFTIPGRLPCLNDYIKIERGGGGRYGAARAKKEIQDMIQWAIKGSALRAMKLEGPVTIHYLWIEKDRRRDKDNIAFAKKFVQDALVGAGVLENDGWRHVEGFTDSFAVDAKNPRVEVTIEWGNQDEQS